MAKTLSRRFADLILNRRSWVRPLVSAMLSGALLIVAFPPIDELWAGWIALVPWLVSLQKLSGREAFWWSCLVGLICYLGSMTWLSHVTTVGLLLLCVYLSLFFGLFGWCASRVPLRGRGFRPLIVLPSLWVAIEFARSHLLSGFGWNLLGHSQTDAARAIQIADLTGVWGVSWLVAMVNVAIARVIAERDFRKVLPSVAVTFVTLCAVASYGKMRLNEFDNQPHHIRVAVVQGNIPQDEKWDAAHQQSILQRYEELTRQAAKDHPQLIIWPETSVPGYFGLEPDLTQRVQELARSVNTPLLVGAPMGLMDKAGVWKLTNSAALISPSGEIVTRYNKLHLVPFGEFIPLERALPWLRDLLPPIGDFIPGNESTVFTTAIDTSATQAAASTGSGVASEQKTASGRGTATMVPASKGHDQAASIHTDATGGASSLRFGVLICFEDVFPQLARAEVRNGAQMLATITNDAWFGDTGAAYQHAQASTFRAVELRVPMVRAANTGWSGCIDAAGRWRRSVRNEHGKELFVTGALTCPMALDHVTTVYERWGDWFAWMCIGMSVWSLWVRPAPRDRRTRPSDRCP